MAGQEVFAVVACVANVVSAYRDGGELVKTLKERRQARKALPPSHLLEQSLEIGPRDIEASHKQGLDRFGVVFAKGDREFCVGPLFTTTHANKNVKKLRSINSKTST